MRVDLLMSVMRVIMMIVPTAPVFVPMAVRMPMNVALCNGGGGQEQCQQESQQQRHERCALQRHSALDDDECFETARRDACCENRHCIPHAPTVMSRRVSPPPPPAAAATAAAAASAYEKLRQENIARNRLLLSSLGVEEQHALLAAAVTSPPPPQSSSSSSKRRKTASADADVDTSLYVRRSARHVGREQPDYRDDAPTASVVRSASSGGKLAGEPVDDGVAHSAPPPRAAGSAWDASGATAASDSTRNLEANVALMISAYLGKSIGVPNKDPVIRLLQPPRVHARFNKFAGILEWRNAIVLWINKDSAQYENTFSADFSTVTWFMSESSTLETPAIVRLLHCGSATAADDAKPGAVANDGDEAPPPADILLFCRDQSTGDPYVCCGRVKYAQYFPQRFPVKFLFTLLDRERLMREADFCKLTGLKI